MEKIKNRYEIWKCCLFHKMLAKKYAATTDIFDDLANTCYIPNEFFCWGLPVKGSRGYRSKWVRPRRFGPAVLIPRSGMLWTILNLFLSPPNLFKIIVSIRGCVSNSMTTHFHLSIFELEYSLSTLHRMPNCLKKTFFILNKMKNIFGDKASKKCQSLLMNT